VDDQARSEELTRALTGLEEYVVLAATESAEGGLVVAVMATRVEAACPACGTFSDRVKSYRTCTVTDSPTHGRRCRLRVTKRAFRCVTPGCVRKSFTESTGQVACRARVTTRCGEQMGGAGRVRCTASVAAEFGVSWPTAWAAIAARAARCVAGRSKRTPVRLGIDETRLWWRQPWLTGLVDLDTGELIDVIEGRTGSAVGAWLDALDPDQRARIDVVVTDPHAGYRRAVADRLDATQVVDRFHVAMLANRAVTDVRRRRIREQADRRGRKIDPGWRARRDLLRRRDRLSERGWRRVVAAMEADNGHGHLDGELLWTWAATQHLTDLYDHAIDRAHATAC